MWGFEHMRGLEKEFVRPDLKLYYSGLRLEDVSGAGRGRPLLGDAAVAYSMISTMRRLRGSTITGRSFTIAYR